MGLFPLLRAVRHLQFSQCCNWMHHLWPWRKLSNGFLFMFFVDVFSCFCHPSCHTVMVMVCLSPFWPEAVLIKALHVRESTQEDWRGSVMAVRSLNAHSVWLHDLVNIAISKGHSRWCPSCICWIRTGTTEHHRIDSAPVQGLLRMTSCHLLLLPFCRMTFNFKQEL